METATKTVERACPACARLNREQALVCGLCGEVLRRARATVAAEVAVAPVERVPADTRASREPWLYLAFGLVTAPLLAWLPVASFMGWFLAALVHEMGHAAAAWLCGMPSMPAISLAGHAAAMHGEQLLALCALFVAGGAVLAWRLAGRARVVALTALGLGYPLLALTPLRELFHLLAGHAAELAFATLCLVKALHGGFTDSRAERALHGTVGAYLVGTNAWLCFGLVSNAAARADYRSSGSFGLTNDYLRVAEQLGWSVQAVATPMLLASLAVLPAALALERVGKRQLRG